MLKARNRLTNKKRILQLVGYDRYIAQSHHTNRRVLLCESSSVESGTEKDNEKSLMLSVIPQYK